jgi:hypothetical protein
MATANGVVDRSGTMAPSEQLRTKLAQATTEAEVKLEELKEEYHERHL